jgi:3-oxoacyl-[acyl-carrier protein] reductase
MGGRRVSTNVKRVAPASKRVAPDGAPSHQPSHTNGAAATRESPAATAAQTTRGGCALITGASRGIGAATAIALAQDGWTVGINYNRDSAGADQVCSEIREAGGNALALCADVASVESTGAILEELTEAAGPIRILVNNAGITSDNLSMRLSDEDWDRVLDVNLTAAFRLTRAVLRPMMRERFGRVINVASVVGERANPGQANYAAAKGGLIAFTRTVAAEVAKRSITVNAVAPGLIETELTREITENGSESGLLEAIPAQRAGTPEEVAACIRFLASDEASYITGTVLTVDGGMSA